jgi:hypothetical protein
LGKREIRQVSNADLYKAQAERCRRLAAMAEDREAKMLRNLADEYEAEARALEKG